MIHPREAFLRHCARSAPATLACFNIASFKRYNDALGHIEGDAAIAQLEATLARHISQPTDFVRFQSDSWLARLLEQPLVIAKSIMGDFRYSLTRQFGWEGRGRRGEDERSTLETSSTVISRAVRCLLAPAAHPFEVKQTALQLLRNCHGFSPDEPVWLADVDSIERLTWSSVAQQPIPDPYCPFCRCGVFSWTDGDFSVYGGDGVCRECGAAVSFSNAIEG